jgi:hypothetical protein
MASGLNQIALGRARSRGVNAASPALISSQAHQTESLRQTPAQPVSRNRTNTTNQPIWLLTDEMMRAPFLLSHPE